MGVGQIFMIFFILAVIAFIFAAARKLIEWVEVQEGKQVVIYRLGKFSRIAGPGSVWVLRGVEKVSQTFDVRQQPKRSPLNGIMVNGQPMGLTFSFWIAFDPVTVSGGSQAEQRRMTQYNEQERWDQARTILRSRLVSELSRLAQEEPPLPGSGFAGQLAPILPGSAQNNTLMKRLRADLATDLRPLGFILNNARPFQIVDLEPPESLRKGFDRNRSMTFLRAQFPNLDDQSLAQYCAALEGGDYSSLQRVIVEGAGGQPVQIEKRQRDARGDETRIKATVAPPSAAKTAAPEEGSQPAVAAPSAPETLSASDLKVLKRISTSTDHLRAA